MLWPPFWSPGPFSLQFSRLISEFCHPRGARLWRLRPPLHRHRSDASRCRCRPSHRRPQGRRRHPPAGQLGHSRPTRPPRASETTCPCASRRAKSSRKGSVSSSLTGSTPVSGSAGRAVRLGTAPCRARSSRLGCGCITATALSPSAADATRKSGTWDTEPAPCRAFCSGLDRQAPSSPLSLVLIPSPRSCGRLPTGSPRRTTLKLNQRLLNPAIHAVAGRWQSVFAPL